MDGYRCKSGQIKIKPPSDHEYRTLKGVSSLKVNKASNWMKCWHLMAIAESEYHSNDKISEGFGAKPKKTFQGGILAQCEYCWPVCVRMCPWSSQGLEKAFPQSLHTQGSVCVLMCIFSAPRLMYSFSQYLQLKYFLLLHSQRSCLHLARPMKLKCSLWQSKHSNLSRLLQLGGTAGKIVTRGKEGGWRLSLLLLSPAMCWICRFTSAEDWAKPEQWPKKESVGESEGVGRCNSVLMG